MLGHSFTFGGRLSAVWGEKGERVGREWGEDGRGWEGMEEVGEWQRVLFVKLTENRSKNGSLLALPFSADSDN